jgi:hypothetical protein
VLLPFPLHFLSSFLCVARFFVAIYTDGAWNTLNIYFNCEWAAILDERYGLTKKLRRSEAYEWDIQLEMYNKKGKERHEGMVKQYNTESEWVDDGKKNIYYGVILS